MQLKKLSFRFVLWFLGTIIVLGFLTWGIIAFHQAIFFPVSKVAIQGDLQQLNQHDLKRLVKPFVQTGLFSVNLKALQTDLQQIPNVAYAEVKRVWPNKINIILVDQSIVAYWNQNQLMNIYGETFPTTIMVNLKQLPQFSGPEGSEVTVLSNYQQMRKLLQPLNLTITAIHLNLGQTWQLVLSNGIRMELGNKDLFQRTQKFVAAYPNLIAKHKNPPKSVNLEYPHGMAVKW